MAKKTKHYKEIWLQREGSKLAPCAEMDFDYIASLKPGQRIICYLVQPQDPVRRRLYEAVVSKVAKGTGRHPESIKNEISWRLGLVRGVETLPNGQTYYVRADTSEMEPEEFYQYTESALDVICKEIVPGATVKEILDGVYQYAGLAEVQP